MSKKLLRAPRNDHESEEDDDDDDDDEALNDNFDDDDDDDDDIVDDEEEEEEEEDSPKKNSKKRKNAAASKPSQRKRPKASAFIDLEAEASDDDEEDAYHGRDEQMDEETKELIRQQDRRRAQAGGSLLLERSVAELSRQIEERHRRQVRPVHRSRIAGDHRPAGGNNTKPMARKPVSAPVVTGGRGGIIAPSKYNRTPNEAAAEYVDDDGFVEPVRRGPSAADLAEDAPEIYSGAVAQQSLVPSVSDPSLWMVSCANGKEQELVLQIMNKCVAYARQGKPLGITAAIAAQTKGKIYIESFSEPAVVEAIANVRGLLQYTMRLVPIGDMTTVMTVVSKKNPVRTNEWVRMMRGHYKGDLALVKAVKESGLKCVVQCVPRLDLTLADLPPEERRVRNRAVRPPQKFFNPQEVAALGRQSLRRQRFPGLDVYCDYFEGNFYHDGYLLKEMTVGSMVKPCSEEDPPSLDELQSFQRRSSKNDGGDDGAEENEGSKIAASLLDELSELQGKTGLGAGESSGGLMVGDTVEVIEGDLIGMRGKLISLDGSTVKVKPHSVSIDLGGTTEVEFLIGQVRKYIEVGAHVKVTDGRYANETGVVVAMERLDGDSDFTAVVLTDVTNKEISVRTSQLRESTEIAAIGDTLQGYELYDLVVLSGGGSANEVGVIVRVGREDFTVINNHGIPREIRPEELRGKRNSTSMRAVALDVQGNQIRCGDTVTVAEGPHKGKSATIKRMSRAQLFLHSQTRAEHAGIFVVRSRSCILSGSKSQNRGSSMDAGVSPFATPQSQSSKGSAITNKAKRDDGLMGKSVRIQAGQWKGYIGTVSDTTATHVQVELHSRLKKVMVVRERVMVVGDKFGAVDNAGQGAVGSAPLLGLPQTMATPLHAVGGATPAIHGYGGATPGHDAGTSDEVWRPGGAIDQENAKDDGWGSGSPDNFGESAANGSSQQEDGWKANWVAPITEKHPNPSNEATTLPRNDLLMNHEQPDDAEDIPDWFMDRVCVQIKSTEEKVVIKEVHRAEKTALVEKEDKTTTTVRTSEVTMVAPSEHDTVLVIGGNEIGLEGSLVCVDGSDAILKDANDEFKIINFVHLVKISSDS